MRPARFVLTILLAFAIAVLPAIGGAVSVVKAVEAATAAMMAADECCEHQDHSGASKSHHGAMDDCASLAACAAKCFVYAGVAPVEAAPFDTVAVVLTLSPSPAFVSHSDPPPFPPPRA